MTWFNPPYSKNVSSNIGKKFFDLLNSCFPPNHKLHKIINKNTIKLSYSCTPNIKQIISSHNKRIINESSNKARTTKLCNCRDKPSCPLQGKCLEQSLVYQATISETNTNKIDTYIGITENTFKTRFNQHMSSFRLHFKKSATALSEHVWKLKDNKKDFKISWKIIEKSAAYSTKTKKCNVCPSEKYFILEKKPTLNERKEILSTCMHTRKYLLKNAKESRRTTDELDLDGHDGANEIEAVPDDAPEEDGEKHCVVRK
ncbi:hypothetical protein ElyMa_000876700 [Elysia marginata]|uniref:GIY-YIG domain-containing protein n=1 Tax=Elysia marginata TaxID=1093978 RepID=A0AAV4H7T4_9GAST|nr:hypothetical protein ElyMa_000876700 [Elysia marginata]